MKELYAQLLTVARSMWRFRWPAVLVAWLVGVVGLAAVFMIPDQYDATARIYVDTQSILKPLMAGLAVQPNVEQQVSMLTRTLISRPNVEKLVRMADLDLKSGSKAEQDALVSSLMTGLEIKSTGRDNLYTLSFRDRSPAKAQRVIQSLVSIFVESGLGATRGDTNSAKAFLDEQIKIYEGKLRAAEARLKDFRLRNLDLEMGNGKDSASQLADIKGQLNQAKLDLREAENGRDAARKQLSEASASASAGASASSAGGSLLDSTAADMATPEIDARIQAQQSNLDGLLQSFTEQHPDVISARRMIHDLQQQKKKQIEELRRAALASPPAANNDSNPVYQELSSVVASSEVQVAALKARVAEYSSRYNRALEAIRSVPELESEASQLNRDYAINKKNYEDLVARRESASMSGELDMAAGVADFRLIDPPRVSPKPVSPNRLVLLPLAMLLSLASGLFTAFVASQLRPVFHSLSELRAKVEFPMLGVVSMVATDTDVRREKVDLLRFLLSSGGLIGIFVVTLITMSAIAARQG